MSKGELKVPQPTVLTGEEAIEEASRVIRAENETKRGIKRDRKGRIIRDKKWKKERVEYLKNKKQVIKARIEVAEGEKKKDLENRLKTIEAEIKQLEEEPKTK